MINIDNEIKKTKEELEELHKRLKKLNDLKMVRESLKSLSREELEERVILLEMKELAGKSDIKPLDIISFTFMKD